MSSASLVAQSCGHNARVRGERQLDKGKLDALDAMQAFSEAGDAGGRTRAAARSAARLAHVMGGCFAKTCRALAAGPPLRGGVERPVSYRYYCTAPLVFVCRFAAYQAPGVAVGVGEWALCVSKRDACFGCVGSGFMCV
mmetsp:Transcript_21195/g.54272  ORF Transcript_21195/g.54272 Transcript_21195/m.54272 type:complete len:139 (+) Transcript_21195:328-744(+)